MLTYTSTSAVQAGTATSAAPAISTPSQAAPPALAAARGPHCTPGPTRRGRGRRLLWCTVAASALVTGAAAAPALAVVRDTDSVKIQGGKADFGNGRHLAGQPTGSGTVSWDHTPTNLTARLTGRVYWDDPFSGGCARVVMRLVDQAGSTVGGGAVASLPACRVGSGAAVSRPVSLSISSPRGHAVLISTQQGFRATGPWQTTGTVRRLFGEVAGRD